METPLAMYRHAVLDLPVLEDKWFGEALARYRAGDDDARWQILGCCLRAPLEMVESRFGELDQDELLDRVQDANAVLVEALATFPGTRADEFLRHVEGRVSAHLDSVGG